MLICRLLFVLSTERGFSVDALTASRRNLGFPRLVAALFRIIQIYAKIDQYETDARRNWNLCACCKFSFLVIDNGSKKI